MGKTEAYLVAAILVGVVSMLPVIMLTPKGADPGYYFVESNTLLKEDVERAANQEELGIRTAPSSPFQLSLILLLGLVSASGVSFYFKRRMC